MAEPSEKIDFERQYLHVLTQDYVLVYDVDLYKDRGKVVKILSHSHAQKMNGMKQGASFVYSEHIRKFAEQYVVGGKKGYLEKLDRDYILQQMKSYSRYAFRFDSFPNLAGNQHYEVHVVRANPDGFDGRVLIVSREIDDIVKMEEQRMRQLEEQYEKEQTQDEVLEALGRIYHAIFRIDLERDTYERIKCQKDVMQYYDARELSASRSLEKICEQAVDERFAERMKEFFDLTTLAKRLEKTDTLEMECVIKDGNWHRARFIVKRRNWEGKAVSVLYVTQVIDEEKRYQERLLSRVENADLANRAKTEFISQVAHDIRTPMNALFGFMEIARANPKDAERVAYALDRMYQAGTFLKELVSDVLDIAKMESDKLQLHPVPTSLRAFFEDMYEGTVNEQSKVRHRFVFDTNFTHDMVLVDVLRLKQIYANILSNAVKYTPEGGRVEFHAWEQAVSGEEKIRLTVQIKDTGIGMSKEFMDKMFVEYERGVDTRINEVSGYGLGLSIVKRLVNLMGGTILVESELGKGSTFTVSLEIPYLQGNLQENAEVEIDYDKICAGMHLLVAEDNELNREVITELLKMHHMTCDCVENGALCLERIKGEKEGTYDAILMDMQMPVMNGVEATRQIRSLPFSWTKEIPIFAMTANAMKADVENCLKAGMNGHFSKPVDMQEMMRLLANIRRTK